MFPFENKLKCYISLMLFFYFLILPSDVDALFFDWFWPDNKNSKKLLIGDESFPFIPFEYESEDEKFLEEASKYTNLIKSSSLDVCQHKVILQMKVSCNSMTEEELSKISVNLLNCQSEVDGRKIFPCTEAMNLKECIKDMDANMWNAYHLMNNRARAVCLAARRTQFHALSEMTINKLMVTAHDQILKMSDLLKGQEKLETLTQGTLNSVEKSNADILKQQHNMTVAQKKIQDFVTLNLEQLTIEKALITAGNEELAKMVALIKEKLDEANQQLISQSKERAHNHYQILQDIEKLQMQAFQILQEIGLNTGKLLTQHEIASQSYQTAFENLLKINETVFYLLKIINVTKDEINEKFYWIEQFLNGTGNHVERLLSITFHVIYLLFGMLFASFLNFSSASRAILAIIVPLNLFVTYYHGPHQALDFYQISYFLVLSIIGFAIFHKLYFYFLPSKISIIYSNKERSNSTAINNTPIFLDYSSKSSGKKNSSPKTRGYLNSIINKLYKLISFPFNFIKSKKFKNIYSQLSSSSSSENLNGNSNKNSEWNERAFLRDNYSSSSHSRVNEWLQSKVNYTRDRSPSSMTSGSPKSYCSAVCRSGRRCRMTTQSGRDFCHIHLMDNSIEF